MVPWIWWRENPRKTIEIFPEDYGEDSRNFPFKPIPWMVDVKFSDGKSWQVRDPINLGLKAMPPPFGRPKKERRNREAGLGATGVMISCNRNF